jgi:predicted enzyme related to lactoylglutathione lyase
MTTIATYAPGTFCWADLGTTDAAAAKRFYTELFGWNYQDMPMGPDQYYTMLELGGKLVCALYQLDAQQPNADRPPSWLSYISVESADRVAERARELGGTVGMEPFDVYDSGRMALLIDPTGATVGLWEPRNHIGAGVVGEPNTLCWNELTTADVEKAGGFYSGLLGWQAVPQPMGDFVYTLFKSGEENRGGMFQITPDMGPMQPFWLIYFGVDDCDGKTAKAKALGAKVVRPPTDIPEVGRFAILQDPQGAGFAIIKGVTSPQG